MAVVRPHHHAVSGVLLTSCCWQAGNACETTFLMLSSWDDCCRDRYKNVCRWSAHPFALLACFCVFKAFASLPTHLYQWMSTTCLLTVKWIFSPVSSQWNLCLLHQGSILLTENSWIHTFSLLWIQCWQRTRCVPCGAIIGCARVCSRVIAWLAHFVRTISCRVVAHSVLASLCEGSCLLFVWT